ncbi:ABC transporter permease [uncultured Sphaerochaeta sp.]|uniref:ABC transporter permease n=1 Tax=uncultured Sphaerochaeta sp. TaxID=886478 RepID=UPI002A0A6312|nr:ABC transporter permease [uncultured Sphaerochaeta sp.]
MNKYKKTQSLKIIIARYGIWLALLALIIILSIASPVFFTVKNFLNVFRQISITSVLAIGVTFVILTGGIDLSLGSIVAIAGVSAASFAHPGKFPLIVSISAGIGIGIVFGLFIGVLVSKGKVASFIVTLGVTTIARGMALLIAKGRPVSNLAENFNFIGNGTVLFVPIPIIIAIVVLLLSAFLLNKTKFGRYVYAIGGNIDAAYASGINVDSILLLVYVICSGCAGLAGVMQAARIQVGQPSIGSGYELTAIAAVVIGGTSLAGGIGTIYGTIVGSLIMGFISNGLDLLNVSSYYQQIIQGLIIIGAVLLDVTTKGNRQA